MDIGDFPEDIWWSFASLGGGVPYPRTEFRASDGNVADTCDEDDDSGSSPGTQRVVMIVIIVAAIIALVGVGYCCYRIFHTDGETDMCGGDTATACCSMPRITLREALPVIRLTLSNLRAMQSTIPELGAVLSAIERIVNILNLLLEEDASIEAAGKRILSVVKVLELAHNTREFDFAPEEAAIVERYLDQLKTLLDGFAIRINNYRQMSWWRRKWIALVSGKSLGMAALDRQIATKLDDIRQAYGLARDAHINRVLRCAFDIDSVRNDQYARI